ncbi:MAG: SPOR domain-containing protein [Gammaproteobacteria bacterium]|jgi:cell division protein FtsN
MAKRRRKTKRRASPAREAPGWLWMLFGLAIGLSVAAAVWMKDRGEPVVEPESPRSASLREEDNATAPEPRRVETPAARESRFDFYEMLPRFEVIVPEEEPEARPDNRPGVPARPGTYVLQAGSFGAYEDADRMKAQLALQGIPSRIQRVSIDDRTYHRVRIGPVSDPEELDDLRGRLRDAKIEVLMIRVADQ